MLKDVIDGLKIVTDGIESIKTITEAVKSGKDYIKTKHADVQNDLRLMVDELQKSLLLIKRSSAVLTNFRFAISTDVLGLELTRFNNYFIQSKAEAEHLSNHIDDLRTHCSKIRDHAKRIGGNETIDGFTKIFSLLGLNSPQRELKLGQQLDKLAYEDFSVAKSAAKMLECLKDALNDVQNSLGNGGAMYPGNVPNAAALLTSYGSEFEKTEEQATLAVRTIRELVAELQ